MTEPTVTAEVHQTLDALLHFASGITLHLEACFDGVAKSLHISVAKVIHLLVSGDACLLTDLKGGRATHSINVGKGVSELLTTGEIDSCNTCHNLSLALTLLVARVLTNDSNDSLSTDHLTLLTNLFDAGSYLHDELPVGAYTSRVYFSATWVI
jgi:hypothetical protein